MFCGPTKHLRQSGTVPPMVQSRPSSFSSSAILSPTGGWSPSSPFLLYEKSLSTFLTQISSKSTKYTPKIFGCKIEDHLPRITCYKLRWMQRANTSENRPSLKDNDEISRNTAIEDFHGNVGYTVDRGIRNMVLTTKFS